MHWSAFVSTADMSAPHCETPVGVDEAARVLNCLLIDVASEAACVRNAFDDGESFALALSAPLARLWTAVNFEPSSICVTIVLSPDEPFAKPRVTPFTALPCLS